MAIEEGSTWDKVLKAVPVIGGVASALLSGNSRKKQLQDQKELNEQQMEQQKQMALFNQNLQKQNYAYYTPELEKQRLKDAGLNTALMYEGGGGVGGANIGAPQAQGPSTSQAATDAQNQANSLQKVMVMANAALMAAQTRKTNIEADKAAGVDTQKAAQDRATGAATEQSIKWQTMLSQALSPDTINKIKLENEQTKAKTTEIGAETHREEENARKTGIEADWMNEKFRTWEDLFMDDRTEASGKYKRALVSEYEMTIQMVENAKQQNQIQKAETAIKNFEAKMTQSGLSKDSPWYVKFLTELLNKTGLNPLK